MADQPPSNPQPETPDATTGPRVVPFASKSRSNYSWSPLQALEEFVEEVRSKKINPSKLIIAYFEDNGQGRTNFNSWQSCLERHEEVALFELLKTRAVERWRS